MASPEFKLPTLLRGHTLKPLEEKSSGELSAIAAHAYYWCEWDTYFKVNDILEHRKKL